MNQLSFKPVHHLKMTILTSVLWNFHVVGKKLLEMVVKQTSRPVANFGHQALHFLLSTNDITTLTFQFVCRSEIGQKSVNGRNFVELSYAFMLVLRKKLKWSNCLPKWKVQCRMSLTPFFSLRKLSVACFQKLMVTVTFYERKTLDKENQIESGRDWPIFPQILWLDIYLVILKIYT